MRGCVLGVSGYIADEKLGKEIASIMYDRATERERNGT